MAYNNTINNNIIQASKGIYDNNGMTIKGSLGVETSRVDENAKAYIVDSGDDILKQEFARFYNDSTTDKSKEEETSAEELNEKAREVIKTISSSELEQLKSMQVDISSVSMAQLMGLVMSLRSVEHSDKVLEDISEATASDPTNKMISSPDYTNKKVDIYKENATDTPYIAANQEAYLLKNNMELTLKNLYTSRYGSNNNSKEKTVDETLWKDMLPQVEDVIDKAGYKDNDKAYEGARFMLAENIPITTDNIRNHMAIIDINENGIDNTVLESNMAKCISNGIPIEDANVYYEAGETVAKQLLAAVQDITEEDIKSLLNNNRAITIHNLKTAEATADSLDLQDVEDISEDAKYITAKRQLEEIRLMMTSEASIRLVNKDMNIDTRTLEEVVDTLKAVEKSYYRDTFMAAGVEATSESIALYKEAIYKIDELPKLPSYALGMAAREEVLTVNSVSELGSEIKSSLAENAYETMMTKPRSDMGDSIHKAFRNVDDILDDMKLDINTSNQRAVRILAYNSMEMTEENILRVKNADVQVNELIDKLTPEKVLNLIRDNINPLNIPIDELNDIVAGINETYEVSSEESYSKFLLKAERNNKLTEEERESYVGIYRLLHKVAKSDGGDTGYLVNTDRDLTLANLLSAHRTTKATGMDVSLDENSGFAEVDYSDNNSIYNQIMTSYNKSLARDVMHHITPDILKNISREEDIYNMTLEQLRNEVSDYSNKEQYINDNEDDIAAREIENLMQLVGDLTANNKVEAILDSYNLPRTVQNMLSGEVVLSKGSIFSEARRLAEDNESDIDEAIENIAESIDDSESINQAYEQMSHTLTDTINGQGKITAMDISTLKLVNAGFNIVSQMAKRETYQVPILAGDEVNIINLSIVRDGEAAGRIEASIEASRAGRVNASLVLEEGSLRGYIASDTKEGNDILKGIKASIVANFNQADMEAEQVVVGEDMDMAEAKGLATTNQLYSVAKMLVKVIKSI